jgi:glutamyl-tRNA synthetase
MKDFSQMLRLSLNSQSDLNIQNLRIAILNHLVSKQKQKNLIVRLEDISLEKGDEGKEKNILEVLNLFSIDYSQVVHQSDYLKYHQQIAMQFLVDNKAFNCFCSDQALQNDKEELEAQGKPYQYSGFCENLHDETTLTCEAPFVVRIKKPEKDIEFTDVIYGNIHSKPFEVDSFPILQHNKKPTYNFACAIDDMIGNIDTVIRDQNLLKNTAKQIFIRELLGYDKKIEYIHIPTLDNDDMSVQSLIDDGYLPIAIANYMVTLGFDTPLEFFSLEEALEWFDISKISQEAIYFDLEKLKQFNKEHIDKIDNLRLSKLLGYADEDIGKLAKVYLKEFNTLKEIKEKIDLIFSQKDILSGDKNHMESIKKAILEAPFIEEYDKFKTYIVETTAITDDVDILLKSVLTGSTDSIELSKIYPFIKNYLGEVIK